VAADYREYAGVRASGWEMIYSSTPKQAPVKSAEYPVRPLKIMMSWRCPACATTVQHSANDPRLGVVYRCYICRLDLVTDPETGKMRLAPLTELKKDAPPRKREA